MKVKLDENLPARLVELLEALGHEVDTVPAEQLAGMPDLDVWAAARAAGRLFITQGLDFSDVRQFAPGSHPGILVVRLREPGRTPLSSG
jgi:predicted nuclease of predicted toxin-antitoxin system